MTSPKFDSRSYWEDRFADQLTLGTVGELGLREPYIRWLYRVRRSVFRQRIAPLARGKSWSVADIGCGTGFYVDLWNEVGVRSLVGIDITDKVVDTLSRKYPENRFIRADIAGDDLATVHDLDAVSAFDVLFHIVDDPGFNHALRTIAAMLRKGGYLFLTDVFQHEPTFDEGHQVGRSLDRIVSSLAAAGFDIIERRAAFFLMADPTDTRSRLLRRMYFAIHRAAARSNWRAWATGCVLYPIERIATRIVKEGPSIELLIARRR